MLSALIIVPAFNESDSIEQVIHSLAELQYEKLDVLVIDDCSTDDTGWLAEMTGKATVVSLSYNLGIGGAVQTGFMYARERDYECAIQFDGDGQHMADEIPGLLRPIEQEEADVVIGSRFIEPHEGFRSSASRRFGIRVFQGLIRLITGQKITDSTSGFRAYNRSAIALLANDYPSDFPEPEAILLLGRNGFRIREVFVKMQGRMAGSSSIGGLKSIYYMIKVSFSIIISGIRPKIKSHEKPDGIHH